jgi:hypothetical protein
MNWNLPTITDLYTDFLSLLKDRDLDLAKGLDPAKVTVSNPVADMMRWNSANGYWEIFNGVSWAALATTYNINVSTFGGQAAAYYTNITARLGYTPANQAGDTFTGPVTVNGKINVASVTIANTGGTYEAGSITADANWGMVFRSATAAPTSADFAWYSYGSSERMQVGAGGLYVNGSLAWTAASLTNLNQLANGPGYIAGITSGMVTGALGYTPASKAGDTFTGRVASTGAATGNNGIAAAAGGLGEFEATGNGVGAALMAFHRPGSYGSYFGLDTDNQWKVGGWTAGATSYPLLHTGNLSAYLLGFGQSWGDYTASRASGVAYTNSTGRAIAVKIETTNNGSGNYFQSYVNGLLVCTAQNNAPYGINLTDTLIVPPGHTYQVNFGVGALQRWCELR